MEHGLASGGMSFNERAKDVADTLVDVCKQLEELAKCMYIMSCGHGPML